MQVGIDVVTHTHNRCTNKVHNHTFALKVCTTHEQQLILQASNANHCMWAIWSLKEAAYKTSCFAGNRKTFVAKHYTVLSLTTITTCKLKFDATNLVTILKSKVAYKDSIYFGYTFIYTTHLYSLVSTSPLKSNTKLMLSCEATTHTSKQLYSVEVRNLATIQLADLGIKGIAFSKTNDGIPYVITDFPKAKRYITLSHDYTWLAYAMLLNKQPVLIH